MSRYGTLTLRLPCPRSYIVVRVHIGITLALKAALWIWIG